MLSSHEQEIFPGVEPEKRGKSKIQRKEVEARIISNAERASIKLTHAHHEVIDFVLDFYEHCDDCKNARQLMSLMKTEFSDKGGQKMLYKLFPKGPLSTIHDLTELPHLRHQIDNGFGTSY